MNETKSATEAVEAVFRSLAKEFLGYPDSMEVRVEHAGTTIALTVQPHPMDVSKILGTDGVMCHSMKNVLTQVARRHGFQFHYSVDEKRLFQKDHEPDFEDNDQWPIGRLVWLFDRVCEQLFTFKVNREIVNNGQKTNIYVDLDASEPKLVTDAELRDGLSRIFNAIGSANGRRIFVDRLERRKGTNESHTNTRRADALPR